MQELSTIREFLALKRFAVVGVSRNPKDFTRSLFREFLKRGYDAVPVNPGAGEVDGVRAVARVAEIAPAVDAALLLTKPAVTESVVKECHAAGIRLIWMYRAIGSGAVSPAAAAYCETNGIKLIRGECPFMFLPETALPHRFHALCKKLIGAYPAG
jgi:uncharacterized protein